MAVKQDEERKLEDDPLKHLDALDTARLQTLAEEIAPQVAPPAAALLPKQTEPTREQAKELLSYWIEEGDSAGPDPRVLELLREQEEREGRARDQRNQDEGGAGGHSEHDDRRSTMTSDFIADSAFDGGALAIPASPTKSFGGGGGGGSGGGGGGGGGGKPDEGSPPAAPPAPGDPKGRGPGGAA